MGAAAGKRATTSVTRWGPHLDDVASLIDTPTVIETSTSVFMDVLKNKVVLEGQGDAHAIYDLPLSLLLSVIEVNDKTGSYGPGVLESRIYRREGNKTVVYQLVGVKFFGIKVAYSTLNEVVRDELPGGGAGIRCRLVESLDGKLYESSNSWYFFPIEVKGRAMTYVRFFMRSGIYSPFPGEEGLMKSFLPKQLSDMFVANIREARRRVDRRQGGSD